MRRFLHILLLLAAPLTIAAQTPVELCTEWVATVDDSQHIVLRWSPSPDARAAGYNICTGDTCRPYAVIHNRYDTTLVCRDHSATERHLYRLHVFDNENNPSALTPHFGNIVAEATIPHCDTVVSVRWNAYSGMPGGVGRYHLLGRIEPYQDTFYELYSTDSNGAMAYRFVMPEGATRVHLKVRAVSTDRRLTSLSNTVSVERGTVDSASFVRIDSVTTDTARSIVHVHIPVDTAFHGGRYTLWRSIDGTPWDPIAQFSPTTPAYTYTDRDIHPYSDSLHCYQLSVVDGCGMNPSYSSARCTVVPPPPEPRCWFPNIIVAGSGENGLFKPALQGDMGDLYELHIFDRNGLTVFSSNNRNEGWRPGADIPQGTYAYSLRLRLNNNMIKTFTGTVTVIK